MKTHYSILLSAVLVAFPASVWAQPSTASLSAEAAPVTPANVPASPIEGMPAPGTTMAPNPSASDPVVGDPVNAVFGSLGRPNGVITNPDKSNLLIYERGTILIADGKVSEVKLMPLSTYNAKLAAEAVIEADRQATIARSNALLQMLLADPAWQNMATRDRMAALSKFDREHAGSEAKKYLADLTAVYSAEQLVQAHIQDLQNQVIQARTQASVAQQAVLDAQQRLATMTQNQVILKAQADAARQQSDLEKLQGAAGKSPLLVNPNSSGPGSNTNGSKVGQGGSVLISNGFGTTPTAPSAGTPVTGGNATTPPGMKWVLGPDRSSLILVPDNGPPGS